MNDIILFLLILNACRPKSKLLAKALLGLLMLTTDNILLPGRMYQVKQLFEFLVRVKIKDCLD